MIYLMTIFLVACISGGASVVLLVLSVVRS
jgi:hypothetical protein